MKEFLNKTKNFLAHDFELFSGVSISIMDICILILILIVTKIILKGLKNVAIKKLKDEDESKFNSVFSFLGWFIYAIMFFVTLHTMGVNITAFLAASSALLIGVGLALQTFFQDIISGIFIIFDKTVHVDDIIEINGKVGRVLEIRLRTTRIVTTENKILIIPNHLYLKNSLFNWTQNGKIIRASVEVGVAYGSNLELVQELLIKAAEMHPNVISHPAPRVLFTEFADSSLSFKLVFTINDGLWESIPQSDIRFNIDKLFRENNVEIPFPQRDVYIKTKN